MINYNMYDPTSTINAEENEFFFAFGLAGGHNFKINLAFEEYAEMRLQYRINKFDQTDEEYEDIEIEPCS